MKKRILCVLLCAVMMSLCLVMDIAASESGGELLPDPSFDSVGPKREWGLDALGETVMQAGKNPSKAVTDLHANHAPDNAPYPMPRSGENSIVFRDVNGKGPRVLSQSVKTGIYAECTYKISFWYIKYEEQGSVRIEVKFIKEDGTSATPEKVRPVLVRDIADDWTYAESEFTTPPGCAAIQVRVRGMAVNIAYIDDVSVIRLTNPAPFSMITEEIFHYADGEGDKEATITLSSFYDEEALSYDRISYTISQEGAKQPAYTGTESIDASGDTREFIIHYPQTALKKDYVPYTLEATLWAKGGKKVHTERCTLYRYPRPEKLTRGGIFLDENEEPFHPVIGYRVHKLPNEPGESDHDAWVRTFKNCLSAGITVVQAQNAMAQLAAAAEAGIKLMIPLVCLDSEGNYSEKGLETVEKCLDDPARTAIFAWAPADEPFNKEFDPAPALERAYREIRKADTEHPVYICANNNYPATVKYCDILSVDPYVGQAMQTGVVQRTVASAISHVRASGKTVCAIVQAYQNKDYLPNGRDMRSMIYEAYLAGAKMHGYYVISNATADGKALFELDKEENDIWAEMQGMQESGEFKLLYDYFVRSGQYNGTYNKDGFVVSHAFFHDGKLYALLENTDINKEHEATVESPFIRRASARKIGGNAIDWTVEKGKMTAVLPPCGTLLLELPCAGFNGYEDSAYGYNSFIKDGALYCRVYNKNEESGTVQVPMESYDKSVRFTKCTASYTDSAAEIKTVDGILRVRLLPGQSILLKISGDVPIESLTNEAFYEEGAFSEKEFTDLNSHAWAKEAVLSLANVGIVNDRGEGLYAPGENVTRADFAMFFIRTLLKTGKISDTIEHADNFDDVAADAPYAKELQIGRTLGILNGYGDGNYGPDAPITRQDLMKICGGGLIELGLAGAGTELTGFSDIDLIADYAKDAVAIMVGMGFVQGNADGTINPLGNTSRAEAAVIMHRIFERFI